MAEAERRDITVGEGAATRRIAVLQRNGTAPGIFWLGGYRSDMLGGKASTQELGRAVAEAV